MKATILSLAVLTSLTGCSSQADLDIGDETAKVGQALSDYAATWDGYGEAYQVPGDGEDRIRLTLDENGEGTIRFGEEALFAPASDPNGTYPPTFTLTEGGQIPILAGLRSGFAYPVSGAVVSANRLRLTVELGAVMESWCALQAPEPVAGWECGPSGWSASILESGEYGNCSTGALLNPQPLDCDVAIQCAHCQCDTGECHASDRAGAASFDAALTNDGETLEGTLLAQGERVTVRMTR